MNFKSLMCAVAAIASGASSFFKKQERVDLPQASLPGNRKSRRTNVAQVRRYSGAGEIARRKAQIERGTLVASA
ncbi:hypothetical protein [Geobacter sp. SVR]|uniref:hypothetical protein n=1 Tax=Geobacter sp. SVR TaxID=2495594 RepID=UPI00143F01CD|nr:hypothetical protein [Geobacter sp. SVR]BCS53319.1 hypothetical protein GSVR_16270 [Geobacter sp. SVR]GCF85555.1 hypothetical protein GSbR_21550 [Geobacter sp. SVR]